VVIGTNSSFGALRTWNERRWDKRLKLSLPILLIDEAGQTTETSALIPLTLGAEWVLMAGDLQQLRPTILSDEAKKRLRYWSYGGSLYGRWEASHDVCGLGRTCSDMMCVAYFQSFLLPITIQASTHGLG
jgi:hypothetical protein